MLTKTLDENQNAYLQIITVLSPELLRGKRRANFENFRQPTTKKAEATK
jgi:hypothetical protein